MTIITAADIRPGGRDPWPEDEYEAEALEAERARVTVQPSHPIHPDDGELVEGLECHVEALFEEVSDDRH